jgi:hypothetical protein
MNEILQRILQKSNTPDLLEFLANKLSAADLQSLLMAVYRRRVININFGNVYRQFLTNRFVRSSLVEGKTFTDFDSTAFKLLPAGFESIELSPVAPLGCCSVIAPVNQNNIVSTIRNTEVCSDNTNVMALECVRRRRNNPHKTVKLCSSFRVLRAQKFSEPAAFAHFRVLSLCTSGRDRGNFGFEIESVTEHVQYYLNLIKYSAQRGYHTDRTDVILTAFDKNKRSVVENEIIQPLAKKNSRVRFDLDHNRTEARGYYVSFAYRIYVSDQSNQRFLIVDGGLADWTQKLLSSKKERLLISGFGSERFILCFRQKNSGKADDKT